MDVSREDAYRFLNKWIEESAVIACVSRVGPAVVSVTGDIRFDDESNHVTVGFTTADDRHCGRVALNLGGFESFDYSDVREASEEIREAGRILSALRLEAPTIRVVLYELAPEVAIA